MIDKEFVPYEQALKLKEIGFDEPCFGKYDIYGVFDHKLFYHNHDADTILNCSAPTFSQAINFLYICSNKQIDIELKASDTYEERLRKIDQGCEDLWNLQNSKSN